MVYKLAFPYVPIIPFIVYPRYGQIQPKEADGGYDPQNDMRGSGPWIMDRWEKDVVLRFKKNPDWHFKGRPFFDTHRVPIHPRVRHGALAVPRRDAAGILNRGHDKLDPRR